MVFAVKNMSKRKDITNLRKATVAAHQSRKSTKYVISLSCDYTIY